MKTRTNPSPFRWIRLVRLVVLLGLVAYGFYAAQQGRPPANAPPLPAEREDGTAERYIVKDAVVRIEEGDRIITRRGDVDLTPTVDRIHARRRLERWEHDGSPFGNHEKRLPDRPRGYYHEWVHPTPEASGPGPQRVITGEDGELWYTPDHYETFRKVEEPMR